jgi:hypothetical protein
MNITYVSCRYRGNIEKHTQRARQLCEQLVRHGIYPFSAVLATAELFDDDDPVARAVGMCGDLLMVDRCDTFTIDISLGISQGMLSELSAAIAMQKPIIVCDEFTPSTRQWQIKECADPSILLCRGIYLNE